MIYHRKQINPAYTKSYLLEIIGMMHSSYFRSGINFEWFSNTLTNLLLLTKSKTGIICEVHYKKDGTPYLKSNIIDNAIWSEDEKKFYSNNKDEALPYLISVIFLSKFFKLKKHFYLINQKQNWNLMNTIKIQP